MIINYRGTWRPNLEQTARIIRTFVHLHIHVSREFGTWRGDYATNRRPIRCTSKLPRYTCARWQFSSWNFFNKCEYKEWLVAAGTEGKIDRYVIAIEISDRYILFVTIIDRSESSIRRIFISPAFFFLLLLFSFSLLVANVRVYNEIYDPIRSDPIS